MCDRSFTGLGIGGRSRFVQRAIKRNFCNVKTFKKIVVEVTTIPVTYMSYYESIHTAINKATNRWNSVISSIPNNLQIDITINLIEDLGDSILGGAVLEEVNNLEDNTTVNYADLNDTYTIGKIIPTRGHIDLSLRYLTELNSKIYSDGNDAFYYTVLHEMGHILGMIGIPYKLGLINEFYQIDGNLQYGGSKAIEEYDKYFNNDSSVEWKLIPVEDDGSDGTEHVHPEEGNEGLVSSNPRTIDGIDYPGLDKELMTGWLDMTDTESFIPALSRITIGFLEDIGFNVDYNKADNYDTSIQNV